MILFRHEGSLVEQEKLFLRILRGSFKGEA